MPIEEKAINGQLASLLQGQAHLRCVAEALLKGKNMRRPDIMIKPSLSSEHYVAIEAKIGATSQKKKSAISQAREQLSFPKCYGALALCYPKTVADENLPEQPIDRLQQTDELEFVQVPDRGIEGPWSKGSVYQLAEAIRNVTCGEAAGVAKLLKEAITSAAAGASVDVHRKIAKFLHLPYEPKRRSPDRRAVCIGFLILCNTALLHLRLHETGALTAPELRECNEMNNTKNALLNSWQQIAKINYGPVVRPALGVLKNLPDSSETQIQLNQLLTAVINCAPLMTGIRLDHAGPLYHHLLSTSKNDGSFYTSTPAALLLARLAMPRKWETVDWGNSDMIGRLRIADPACGTGTLLLAAASTIVDRHREACDAQPGDLDKLHLRLVEDILHGFDINRHAIHLAASMLTLSAPRIDYRKMQTWNLKHGVFQERTMGDATRPGTTYAGSLEFLSSTSSKNMFLTGMQFNVRQEKLSAHGVEESPPEVEKKFDLVIMNPPFTRNDIRNAQYGTADRNLIQKREKEIAKNSKDEYRKVISQSTISTFFTPIADVFLKANQRTLATVRPFGTCTSEAPKKERQFLASKFTVRAIVTSHDPKRVYFSENTNIHESLMVFTPPPPLPELYGICLAGTKSC